MSKKVNLIKLFGEFKDRYNSLQVKLNEIRQSSAYTDTGKEQAINKLMEEFKPTVQLYHDKAVEYIDGGLAALQEKWKANSAGRLSDAGYQLGLANVLKMLESGAIRDRDDMQNIIDTYRDDFNAMATIKNLISKHDQAMEFAGLIPADNREYNKRLLGQLKGNVDLHINPGMSAVGSSTGDPFLGNNSVSLAMDSMAEFVNTRLNDDLSLL
ncbi:hypothetical protein HNQ56_004401 [Anaerotaenia torta]|uniref:hypothetical protein n=1 Tax=Anaerotaenia torta TaxID=433293 RepID=UPI003D190B2A